MIESAETAYADAAPDVAPAFYCRRWHEARLRAHAQRLGLIESVPVWAEPTETALDLPPLYVYVSTGRWVVDCPNPLCGSSQVASKTDQRFYCVECANIAVSGKYIPVIWPDEPDAIEHVLSLRPLAFHQNWHAHETLADLRDENALHGIS